MQRAIEFAAPQAQSQPLRAISLMCLACGLFACLDTTAKYLVVVTDLPVGQLVWMRYLGQFVAMVITLGLVAVPSLVRTTRLRQQLLRSLLLLVSTGCNFLALRHLRLDQTTTIGFLTPMMVAGRPGSRRMDWLAPRRRHRRRICRHPARAQARSERIPPGISVRILRHVRLRRFQPDHPLSRPL